MNTSTAHPYLVDAPQSIDYAGYMAMDVHKDTIAAAVALPGREAAYVHGEIANTSKAIDKLVDRLSRQFDSPVLLFAYEADPCGYDLY